MLHFVLKLFILYKIIKSEHHFSLGALGCSVELDKFCQEITWR